jgi:ABC-type dipeptide/oligopeptide/nickel transport system permease subunit
MNRGIGFVRRDVLASAAFLVLAVVALAAAAGPWLAPYDPVAVNLASNYQPSSWAHPLGTDHLGRDTLSRLIAGARVSLASRLPAPPPGSRSARPSDSWPHGGAAWPSGCCSR